MNCSVGLASHSQLSINILPVLTCLEHCVIYSFLCYAITCSKQDYVYNTAFELRACTVPVLIFLMWRSLQ